MVKITMPEPNAPHAPFAYATSVNHEVTSSGSQQWSCPQCTLLNPITAEFCGACMLQKPAMTSPEPEVSIKHEVSSAKTNSADERPFVAGRSDQHDQDLTEPLLVHDAALPASSHTEYVEEDPLQKKRRRRRRRRIRMVLGGTGGLILGAIIFCGPAGLVFGTVAGAAGARYISKRQERKKDARIAQVTNAQLNAEQLNKPMKT